MTLKHIWALEPSGPLMNWSFVTYREHKHFTTERVFLKILFKNKIMPVKSLVKRLFH